MTLTANEQLIIKYVGQNYLTKSAMANIVPCYATGTPYAADWLSKEVGGETLIPIEGLFYLVCNVGKIYQWDKANSEYTQANLPDLITKTDVTDMWD